MHVDAAFAKVATLDQEFLVIQDDMAISDTAGVGCPVDAVPLPPYTVSAGGNQFQILAADYVVGCALWGLYNGGAFQTVVDPRGDPALLKYLNTTFLGDFFPALAAKFPDDAVVMNVSAAAAPTATSSPSDGLVVSAAVNVGMNPATAGGAPSHAFTLGVGLDVGLRVYVNNSGTTPPVPAVAASLSDLNVTLSVVQSSVGTVSVAALNSLLKFAVPEIEKAINAKLAAVSVPLPTIDGVSLVGPSIGCYNGFCALQTNLTVAGSG